MRSRAWTGHAAIKVIIAMGALALVLLWLTARGLERAVKPNPRERVVVREKHSPFDGQRAHKDLGVLANDIGPRPTGSDGAAAARTYLKRELTRAELEVWEWPVALGAAKDASPGINLVAKIPGTHPEAIVLTAHYDTWPAADFRFAGANAGGAATAWLLECARVLGPRRVGYALWLVWLDAEGGGAAAETGGAPGAASFIRAAAERGELGHFSLVIGLEGIGDCFLRLGRDPAAPREVIRVFEKTAHRLGYAAHFGGPPAGVWPGFSAFAAAGIPAILLADGSYGGSVLEHRKYWHTALDTPDRVCAESLQAVGDVLYHALPELEGMLNRQGTPAR